MKKCGLWFYFQYHKPPYVSFCYRRGLTVVTPFFEWSASKIRCSLRLSNDWTTRCLSTWTTNRFSLKDHLTPVLHNFLTLGSGE
jgi:hypothetical protein